MSLNEATLKKLGFGTSPATIGGVAEIGSLNASFSGYGEFTPIKVTSRTTLNNANLERDRSGNRPD